MSFHRHGLAATLAALSLSFALTTSSAQSSPPGLTLMPAPSSVTLRDGRLPLDTAFSASLARFRDARLDAGLDRALVRLGRRLGAPVRRTDGGIAARFIVEVNRAGEEIQSPDEDESYSLEVTTARVTLRATTVVGALRGFETLLQLVTADSSGFYLPVISITDVPRFPWRGLLVDACRHWQPIDVIKRTLDGMAAVKLNVLHWHLSEDQGFRVESKRYPKLQEMGSDGLFYTQAQIKEVVAYARDRGIRVIPEFDMPGHTTSWVVGYPELASAPGPYAIERNFGVFDPTFDPTREEVYQFIDGFVAEIAPLFPDQYWHIGGDEVNGRQWNASIKIQSFMRTNRLKNNDALQAWFNGRLSHILEAHGKRMVGWDEILHPDLPKNSVVQSWRGVEYLGQTVGSGYSAILSAPWYLDHMDSAEKLYLADPLPAGLTAEQAERVLGGEATMWGEQISPETIDSRIWPRLAAIAERFWSPASVRDVNDMYRRLSAVSLELEGLGLGHEAHAYRMIRQITGERGVQALHDLLLYVQPITFGQRARIQQTNQFTPLTRLVDAARPDPWSRNQLNQLAEAAARNPKGPEADALRKVFALWRGLPERDAALRDQPLARDGDAAVGMLAKLGEIGTAALDNRAAGRADPAWLDATNRVLDSASKPQGMLLVVGAEAVRRLVER